MGNGPSVEDATAQIQKVQADAVSKAKSTAYANAAAEKGYSVKQYFVYSTHGKDIAILNDTLPNCLNACTKDPKCAGFSWTDGADPGVASTCWLKNDLSTSLQTATSKGTPYITFAKDVSPSINNIVTQRTAEGYPDATAINRINVNGRLFIEPQLPGFATSVTLQMKANDYINISQIIIRDRNGVNIIRTPSLGVSSSYIQAGIGDLQYITCSSKAIDGTEGVRDYPNLFHSAGNNGDALQISWKTPIDVSSITIYNRSGCCQDRLTKCTLTLTIGSRTVQTKSPLSSDLIQAFYFPPGVTAGLPQAPNALPGPIVLKSAIYGDSSTNDDKTSYGIFITKDCSDKKRSTSSTSYAALNKLVQQANASGKFNVAYKAGIDVNGRPYNPQTDSRRAGSVSLTAIYTCGNGPEIEVSTTSGQQINLSCGQPSPSPSPSISPSPSACPRLPSPSPCPVITLGPLSSARDIDGKNSLQKHLSVLLTKMDKIKEKITSGYAQLAPSDPATVNQQMTLSTVKNNQKIYNSKFLEENVPHQRTVKRRAQTLQEFVLLFFYVAFAIFTLAFAATYVIQNNISGSIVAIIGSAFFLLAFTAFLIRYG
jgi:hypothetical protein